MKNTIKPEMTVEANNRLIAEFMNLKGASKVGGWRYLCDDGYWRIPSEMKYHTSWDWLMPVVDKIGDTRTHSDCGHKVEITNGYTKIENTGERMFFNSCIEGSMLNATYKACIKFVEWIKLSEKGGSDNG